MLTVTDLFAGAGGSSTGMVAVPGVQIRIAANHWALAVRVHNANHPTTDHSTSDLHEEDPRFFPRTDILWASPECTRWSQASGAKPLPAIEEGLFEDPLSDEATTRSRLLMFDVLRFAEYHRYRAMVVENVVDIATRERYRLAWRVWREELVKLGYRYKVVSLNSMHAQALGGPAPQSRDRLYIVCWRPGDRAPDVDRVMRPRARCPRCDQTVESRQAFKPGRTVGRYRQQYVYVHGACGTEVEPAWLPAAVAIDWSIQGSRIGDRPKPLADKTRARIAAGIARYWRPFTAEVAGNTYERRPGVRTWPVDEVLRTLHTTASKALLVPMEGRDGKDARPADLPGRTQTTRLETAMVTPLHVSLMSARVEGSARPVTHELRTLTAEGNNDYLLAPYYGTSETARPVSRPIGTLTTVDRYGLVSPAGGTWNEDATSTDEALRTMTTRDAYALITHHFSSKGDGAEMSAPVWEAMRTLTTTAQQSVVTPGDMAAAEAQVDDCLFRMLEPHEVAAGMAFPTDYLWEGTRRDRVKLAGNAVTPPAARDLIAAVVEAITGEQLEVG